MANAVTRNTPADITAAVRRALLYRGVQIRVARELGVSRAHVSLVCHGHRRSRRVELALAKAVREIERRAANEHDDNGKKAA